MADEENTERPIELGLGQLATLACVLEATASKPGNVHRGADFDDVTFADFLASAVAIGPIIAQAEEHGVGPTVLAAVHATMSVTDTNTNLGSALLLAPLAAVPEEMLLSEGIADVLDSLTEADASTVYEAIRAARPGGLRRVEKMDVIEKPPVDLRIAMEAAADRDLVARQYVNGFEQVFLALTWLLSTRRTLGSLTEAIIHTHIRLMAAFPDSLIARKCGREVARQAADRAQAALDAGSPGDPNYLRAVEDLDFWLRTDRHRRNPGTTADLIAATLFVGLREKYLQPPFR